MICRTMFRLLYFSLPLPFLAVCVVMIILDSILGNIDPEKTDRQTLVRVIQMRDFHQFSPEWIERLTDRADQEFGRRSPNKPVFELHPLEKRIHVYCQTHRLGQPSYLEQNLTLMAKVRYFQWMYEYDSAGRDRKAVLMNTVVEEMRYWQGVYLDYIRFLGLPEPTLAELHQDFQRMIETFKTDASPNEITLIDSFAKDMSRALFASEIQKLVPQPILNLLPGFR